MKAPTPHHGDVWIADPRFNTSNAQLDPGFYGLTGPQRDALLADYERDGFVVARTSW